MPKLLLVDGYSLLYRAYYSSPPFTTKDGEPTGAMYGFIRMVLRLLDEHEPDFAVVALDAHAPTFRHEKDDTYKANRSETPDDLRRQQTLVRELLDGLSIPRYEQAGFEGDDVLGTLACHGVQHGEDVIIVTGDGDALQLVQDKIRVALTKKGVTEVENYGPEEVFARYGFPATMVPDFKGLKGDTSDNIPGVPGIGDKTAMSLLQKFGPLEAVYEHLEEVTPPRIRELLRTHREQAFHSREMATIITNIEIEKEPEAFRYEPKDPAKCLLAAQTARRFEFKSLIARYEASEVTAATDPPENETFEATYTQTSDSAEALAWLTSGNTLTALSQGTDGLMLGKGHEALLYSGPLSELKSWFEDPTATKVAHEAKAFVRVLQPAGIHLQGLVADTLLMAYLLEPARQQHPIPHIAHKFAHLEVPEVPADKRKGKAATLFDEGPSAEEIAERVRVQALQTAVLTEVEPVLRADLAAAELEPILTELELPLIPVLAEMEACGMLLDPVRLRQLGDTLESEARATEAEIWELAGEKFNIGSTKQLQTILYEKMGLEKGRTIKTGASTDTFTLERLAENNPIAGKVLEYRGTTKLKNTYVDSLITLVDPETCRIHTTMNQTGTVSGRISSNDPNLQNIPIRTAQGRQIRKAFVAPKGHVLLSADYSQIELRVLAHITGDAPLTDAFQSGEDVHARTASALFGVAVDAVDKEMRRKAKMTNYAIAYGVSGFGLAKQLGTGTAGDAKEFIERYFETLPGVKQYMEDTLKLARARGFAATLLGRRRPLPEINAPRFQDRSAAERTAINHPIQGSAADIMKLAMLAVHAELKRLELRSRISMQVHDELVFEVPEEEIEIVTDLAKRKMTEIPEARLGLRVPLVVDVGTGCDWDSAKGSD